MQHRAFAKALAALAVILTAGPSYAPPPTPPAFGPRKTARQRWK